MPGIPKSFYRRVGSVQESQAAGRSPRTSPVCPEQTLPRANRGGSRGIADGRFLGRKANGLPPPSETLVMRSQTGEEIPDFRARCSSQRMKKTLDYADPAKRQSGLGFLIGRIVPQRAGLSLDCRHQ
ncbi:MAG: hypothetical protein ACYDBP_15220 [Leptospirales bacterium]